ncbi:hypothetical protein BAU08_15335 [Bordetella bronchialis]|uniref:Uncharacterized protein n=2 Tax=Bordetella bronchialis TaxID=463025 RepID=A0A193FZX4_9BORD|nr:hypothetical protein BAU08_15335 [Bordetella bronchialis]
MQDAHSHFATRIAKAIPRQDLTFARILEHVSATPFYRLGLATRARQTMDRFIGVLEFHGVRASSLIDYEPGRIFRKFGFHWEEKPGLKLKSDIRQGHDVRANIRRLYWLGFEPDEWTG